MIEWVLKHIITCTFEKEVGKGGRFEDPKLTKPLPAMLLKFSLSPDYDKGDQYHTANIIICGPCNYVYVARQDVIVNREGELVIKPLEILGYHDSCWRDSIDRFIFDNRSELSGLRGEGFFDWYNKIGLSEDEVEYLHDVESWRRNQFGKGEPMPDELIERNPFNKRWER